MGNSESVLLKKDFIDQVCDKTYKESTIEVKLNQRLHQSNLEGFIPFRLSKIIDNGEKMHQLIVRIERKGDESKFKIIYLRDSQEPLFSDQEKLAKMFERFFSKKISSIKKAIEKNKDDADVCLLICGAKENGEKAMRLAISFFSWLFETLNLSYSDVDLLAFSTNRVESSWVTKVKFCVIACETDVKIEDFLLRKKENEGSSSKHLFKFVMKIENFSKVEFKEAKLD